MAALEIGPKLWFHAEKGAECEGDLGVDRALALDDLVEGGAEMPVQRESSLWLKLVGIEEFLLEQAAGSGGENGLLFAGHGFSVSLSPKVSITGKMF